MVVASAVLVCTTGLLTFKAMLTCPSEETFLQAAGAGYGDLSRASRVEFLGAAVGSFGSRVSGE